MDSDYKMYILINSDLSMGPGKKAGQVGHGVQSVIEVLCNDKRDLLRKYKSCGQAKIVLKATQTQMEELLKTYPNLCKPVYDAGHTQIDAGSFTALAFYPMLSNEAPDVIKKLKLL